jgi:uncharacterized protein (DUF58 family)
MDDLYRGHLAEGERAGQRYALGLPKLAPAAAAGGALGQRAGSSLEFRDYRDYQAGDDLRHVDWSAYARSDQLAIKLYREEVTPHADVIIDASRSMALEGSAKAAAALGLAALFAAAAGNAGFTHRAWLMGDAFEPVANGNAAPPLWQEIAFEHRGGPRSAPLVWRPRGTRFLVSDLLWPGDPLATLRPLADRAAAVVVIQALGAADADPPEGQSVRLVDSETDEVREVHVGPEQARRYREALARHRQNWHGACRQVGAVFCTVLAEQLVKDWRLDELVASEVLRVV